MEDIEYNYIKRQVLTLTAVDLNCYKAPQMQRRLKTYLSRSGQPNWSRFFRTIRSDPLELSKFKDYLTINVSAFFRDQEKYKFLQASILPDLLRQRTSLRVWSAGCSRGQEVYSLALLLAQLSGDYRQHRLLATDIDNSALEWAKAGGPYSATDIANLAPALLLNNFNCHNNQYWVKDELRHAISFRQHNLLSDPIVGKSDLIVCRNVVIYFQPEAKDKLYRRFYNALKFDSVLFVGGTEIIPKASDIGFETAGISFYRRKKPKRSPLKSSMVSSQAA